MKKFSSLLLVALVLLSSLSVTASAATNAWDYELFELYKYATTARSTAHKATRGQVQVENYMGSDHSVSVAVEMKTGNNYVQYGTVSIPVGLSSGTDIIDSPTGGAVDTRGVIWSSSGGVRATGDLGFYN